MVPFAPRPQFPQLPAQAPERLSGRAIFLAEVASAQIASAHAKIIIEFTARGGYLWSMRRPFACLSMLVLLALALPCGAATGRVIKVLPFYLDAQGRHTRSPSLFERDVYQAYLLQNPEKRSGMMYDVHWKTKGAPTAPLRVQIELRGIAQGNLPSQLVLETTVPPSGWFGYWTRLLLTGEKYKQFGEVTAWRATLWEGQRLLGEQQSFLW